MKKFSLLLTITATSIILGSFTIAQESMLQANNKSIYPINQYHMQPAIANDRIFVSQNESSTNSHDFTMTLPDSPGKQFGRLSFSFNQLGDKNNVIPIEFNLSQTQAFVGTSGSSKQAIAIKDTWLDETGTVWVEFKSPVVPKTTLTIVFMPRSSTPGLTYEYSIAAYPETKYAVPIFVNDGSRTIR